MPGGYEYVVWSYQDVAWLSSRRTGYGNLDYIVPGHAYWINLNNAELLYGYGDKLIAGQTPPEVQMKAGWNLIGHYGLLDTVSVVNALQNIAQYYTTILDDTGYPMAPAETFTPGEGYWVFTDIQVGQNVMYGPSNSSYAFN